MSNVIIENDSQIAFQAITGGIKAPTLISNIIVVIVVLASLTRNIKIVYCNRQIIN